MRPLGNCTSSAGNPTICSTGPSSTRTRCYWAEPVDKDVHDAVAWARGRTGWKVYAPVGGWVLPERGEWRFLEEIVPEIDDIAPGEAGDFVAVGEHLSAGLDATVFESVGLPVYDSLLEDGYLAEQLQAPGEPMSIRIHGGADIGAAVAPDAVTVPVPLVLRSHNPASVVPVRAGQDIVLAWEPSEDPDDEVFMLLDNRQSGFLWNVGDSGMANVSTVLRGGNTELHDDAFLILGRTRTTWVRLPEGRLQVRASTYQWLYLRHVRAYEIEPRLWPVDETTKVRFTAWDGDAGGVEIDAGPGVTVSNVRAIDRGAAQVVADVTVAPGSATGPRDVTVTVDGAPVASARGGAWVVEELPAAGDCASALDEEVPDGAYFATLDGLESGVFDGSSCDIGDPEGPEQAIPVSLVAGQRLDARLLTDGFGATMYIATGCGQPPASRCSDFPTFTFGADLSYTALQDEAVVLVVDSFAQAPGRAQYAVDLRRADPVAVVVVPDYVAAGTSQELRLFGIGAGFSAETASAAWGEGVAVRDVRVDDGVAVVAVEVDAAARGLRTLTAEREDGAVEVPGALSIRGLLPAPLCEVAAQSEPLVSGVYVGSSASGNSEILVPDLCPDASVGEEAVHRVDLEPGQTLQALVEAPDFDSVLYLLPACGEQAVRCSDFGQTGEAEFLEWTAPAEGASVLLVVDGLDEFDQGDYTLHVRVLD